MGIYPALLVPTKHNSISMLGITVVLLLASALRIVGVGWGSPDPVYDRASIAAGQTNYQAIVDPDSFNVAVRSYLIVAQRDPNPHFWETPSFYIYLNAILHFISGDSAHYPPIPPKIDMRTEVPFSVYAMARVVSALMGVLGVAFVYAAARRLFGWQAGLLAALILTVSFIDVQHAHYGTSNVPSGVMFCAALWAGLRLLRPHVRMRDFLLAGALVGLAGSTKYNAGLVGFGYALAGFIVWLRSGKDRTIRGYYLRGFIAVGVAFLVASPFILRERRLFWSQFLYVTSTYITGQGYPEPPTGFPFHLITLTWFGIGPIVTILVFIGIWAVWRRKIGDLTNTRLGVFVVSVTLLIYTVFALRGSRLGDHLLLPTLGPCALLAAGGALYIWMTLRRRLSASIAPIIAFIGVVLIVTVPLAYAVYFDRTTTLPDTRQLAQAWIYTHIPRGAHVHLVGPYNVPLDPADYTSTQTFEGDYRLPSEIKQAQDATVLIVSDAMAFRYSIANPQVPGPYSARQSAFEDRLTAGLTPLVHFSRVRWLGDDNIVTTFNLYHNPGLTIYCLTANCGNSSP